MKVFFPDTNLLMECIELRQLPWQEVAGEDQHVLLILAQTVIREIDRFKSDSKTRRNRRARDLNSGLFRKLLEADAKPVVIQKSAPKVEVALSGASVALPIPHLDLSRPDHLIIAEAVSYIRANPEADVSFISNDTMALHAAAGCELQRMWIPEGWLLPADQDPRQQEIQRLREQVRLLESQAPLIEMCLEGEEVIQIEVLEYPDLPVEAVAELAATIERRHPRITDFEKPPARVHFGIRQRYTPPPVEAITEYLEVQYPGWLEGVMDRLRALPHELSRASHFFEATIAMRNTGGAPAREMVAEFWLSEGLQFRHPLSEEMVNRKPRQLSACPEPPEGKWRSRMDLLNRDPFSGSTAPPLGHYFPARNPRRDPNSFYYKTEPGRVDQRHTLECALFRHKVEPVPFPFLIEVVEEVSGGELICRATAGNLVSPVVRKFPIKIKYNRGEAIGLAREFVAEQTTIGSASP